MVIYISINPIAFTVGPISVGWYGIMLVLAMLALLLWALWAVRKGAKVSYDTIYNVALVAIPSGIIFSRLLHVFERWQYYFQHPAEIIGGAGLTIWGAVLGASLGLWIYSRFRKFSFGYLMDLLAPGIILAQAIGRVGCTILGDDTGVATSLPWGVVYTNPGSPSYGLLYGTHPVVAYEIIFNLIVFAILLRLRGKLKPDGSLFMVYLAFYSVWRLVGDFLREGNPLLFGLHEAQLISIVVLIIVIPLMAWKTRWVKRGTEAAAG